MVRKVIAMAARTAAVWARMVRHRWKLVDGTAVLLVMMLAGFLAFEVDLIVHPGVDAAERRLEFDELVIVAAVFCIGLVIFALRRLAEAKRETARRILAEREARTLALHDALTGLPNRRQFEEALRVAVDSPPRSGASHALLMLDLNGFKRINDVYGHQVGDEVLIQIGGRLNRAVRDGDLVARLGGDEFAVLALHVGGAEAATGLARRVMEVLEPAAATAAGEHPVGTAIGIALFPQDGLIPEELVRKADIALYRAKEEKHRAPSAMHFFEAGMDGLARERDQLERELREAVTVRAIRPYFHPLVSLEGGAITGFEAVPRWVSPTLGPIPPERLIAVAEDCGLIGPISTLLLEQACAAAALWPPHVSLAFNVSGAMLQEASFGLIVVQLLARSGLAPERLELEITESALVRDLEAARTLLGALRRIGVRIALDDFGTGYSSLYHLRAFKPDKIKIDRSFVDGMADDPDNAAIVQALIGLGSGLGAIITAEGVETAEQEAFLRRQGCDQGQGRLFSHAVDAAEAATLLGVPPERRSA
jgi:diguanylate cyclase (GGDEF)-like protein